MSDLIGDEENDNIAEESRIVQLSQVVVNSAAVPPPLEPVKSLEGGRSTVSSVHDERPAAFGPLWKEILIVLLCDCGPITQVRSTDECN